MNMAPRLQLPANFRVRTFGSSRNRNGVGEYQSPHAVIDLTLESAAECVEADRVAIAGVDAHAGGADPMDVDVGACAVHGDGFVEGDGGCALGSSKDMSHISETRLCDSILQPVPRISPTSEVTIISPDLEEPSDVEGPLARKRNKRAPKSAASAISDRKRKRTTPSTITRRWQEVWACKFTWAEGEFNADGDLVGVICQSCTAVSGRRKAMVPKADNLEKHEGKRTCKEDGCPLPHLKKGDTYTKLDCKHVKFCRIWAGRKRSGSVADQLLGGLEGDLKRKGVQFSTLFQILSHGRPMCDYEREQYLLKHLKVKNMPRKHWSETTGWEMTEHLHACVLSALKAVVQSARIISISADEVTAVDNTSWIGVHVYAMDGWERIPHLLHLSCVSESGTADHLTNVIMHALLGEGGLTQEQIACKLVCFGADGVSTFQGPKTGVTTQIREKWAPFCIGASCVSHRVNLVAETLSKYPLVSRLEGMCQSVYSYFCRSSKRHTELQKLADLMETKGNKMLRNVETRWISMRSPAQRIMSEYKTLLVKMGGDMSSTPGQKSNSGAADNFNVLVDVEVLLSLACFIPLLNAVHSLIKLSQARDIFICDFMQSIKVCQDDLARMFIDGSTAYKKADFKQYNEIITLECADIPLRWKELPGGSGISHLLFDFGHTHVFAQYRDKESGQQLFVTVEEFNRAQDNVERQFGEIAQSLCDELDRRFPQQDLLDAFGIIYPQYWMQEGAEESFAHHLSVLKKFYAEARRVNQGKPLYEGGKCYTAPEMLSASKLDNQQGLFKITMKANCEDACSPPFLTNPIIKLWRNLSQSRHLTKLISEYFKVAEIGCYLVLGSVEDERCFSTLKFLKSCHRNRLGKHLPHVVRMFGQKYFSLENFPYREAIDSWKNAVKVGRQGDV